MPFSAPKLSALGIALMLGAGWLVDRKGAAGPRAKMNERQALGYLAGEPILDAIRASGDETAQRRHAWAIMVYLAGVRPGAPAFETWRGEAALFEARRPVARGMQGFARTARSGTSASGVPVLAYTLYNDAAYDHIVSHRLDRRDGLERLRASGAADPEFGDDRTVPPFPRRSVIVKTVWWPVAGSQKTVLPVWDPLDNPPRPDGNSYLTWTRVVAVDPSSTAGRMGRVAMEFAGRRFPEAHIVRLADFYSVPVNTDLARRLMRDPETERVAMLVLGRALQPGDHLALVSANVMTREIRDWVWLTYWWHDRPDEGVDAVGRPSALRGVWRHYKMQASFDEMKPRAADGGPHIAFNPWLEGRFPDGGQGGGVTSNCMTCHHRATWPTSGFLPVTRGIAEAANDPAFSAERLRTSFLWSLPLHARPNAIAGGAQ